MQIDEMLIDYLEDLSCLTLSHKEKQRLLEELKKILSYMERLGELDTDGIAECSHPFDNVNAFREDEIGASFERELILKNAPERNDKMFIAPQTAKKSHDEEI